ncbi:peptidylprolyl isomerase [Marinobacter sp. C2H3]|uniref:peptidylprolyl isomerase n=1 Tax=Marinobacter sp. C2H3 TaxID=3119003 RepID=UPI00300E7AE2
MQRIPVGHVDGAAPAFAAVSVGNRVIPEEDIAREMPHHPAEGLEQARAQAARSLVIRALLLDQAERLALAAESDEEARIARVLEQELRVPEPTDEDVRRVYQANPDRFRSPTLLAVSHILLAAAPDDPEERLRQQDAGRALLAQIAAGGLTFEAAARSHSACDSRHQGGSLGQISRGQTVPEFERPVLALPEGLHPQLVESRYGWHLVRVDQRIEGERLPFGHVCEGIRHYLRESVTRRALRQYLQVLAAEAGVTGVDLELPDSPLMQ